ncbi:hypothetical protein [Granulibacter bethesdensis]|uniref:hypothetical protein n=1 Tax=Granulibacter bethesdensis TaxID=364410 RepID=UPI0012FD6D7A|nr:hypothetical protein [Granulibacter bethesdensis]
MTSCNWEEIASFESLSEYRRFVQWIQNQVNNGLCEEIYKKNLHESEWNDRWFVCKDSGKIWKLSCPDPGYFSGSWLPINDEM